MFISNEREMQRTRVRSSHAARPSSQCGVEHWQRSSKSNRASNLQSIRYKLYLEMRVNLQTRMSERMVRIEACSNSKVYSKRSEFDTLSERSSFQSETGDLGRCADGDVQFHASSRSISTWCDERGRRKVFAYFDPQTTSSDRNRTITH